MNPIKIFTVPQMVAAERAANASGISYDQMMETAGRRTAEAIIERWPVRDLAILILVGPGNNGGDGLVAGRYLAKAGADVVFYLYKAWDPAADPNLVQVLEMHLLVVNADDDQGYRVLRTRLRISDIVIDALLGTGVTRPIGGGLTPIVRQVQTGLTARRADLFRAGQTGLHSVAMTPPLSGTPNAPIVVAIDCPSGLNCDNGALDPLALTADLTVTFAGPKRGHFRFPGAAVCGELVVAEIGIAPSLPEVAAVPLQLATPALAKTLLPPRPLDGHKGTFGNALIAAGSGRYQGAPALAARGAYRVGAGLVGVAVPRDVLPTLVTQIPEATFPRVSAMELLDGESARQISTFLPSFNALLVGPGLGEAQDFIDTLFAADQMRLPRLVVDADGLNLLARREAWPARLPPGSILTPHPGEMARLMGVSLDELREMDRVDTVTEQAAIWGQVVLLKGAYTVVAEPGGRTVLLPFANPALATGGSGDVLSGVVVSLLAQGVAPFEVAVLGGYLHALAGQLASQAIGSAGLLASDIAEYVPQARNRVAHTPT